MILNLSWLDDVKPMCNLEQSPNWIESIHQRPCDLVTITRLAIAICPLRVIKRPGALDQKTGIDRSLLLASIYTTALIWPTTKTYPTRLIWTGLMDFDISQAHARGVWITEARSRRTQYLNSETTAKSILLSHCALHCESLNFGYAVLRKELIAMAIRDHMTTCDISGVTLNPIAQQLAAQIDVAGTAEIVHRT
jgi:hypothetical protein